MSRFPIALPVLALTIGLAPAAFARDIRETKTFTKADGTRTVSHTNFHTKTDVKTEKVTATRTDGQVRAVSEKVSPAAGGGFTVSKSVTDFSGQTHTSTGHVGGGHKA